MSGIAGLINLDGQPVDRQLLRQMTEFMAYRGPDAQEVWLDGPVGFGHALFQTAEDTPRECQPCSLDGQVWITADARIDGRADLIRKLSGHVTADLKSATDPELILHAYHVWGEDCLQHLLGDFAFAIWDGRSRRLFCARDHFGIKPFYYALVGKCLVFSNTLNCVRLHPQVSDELNDLAIADFLLFDFNQDQATTTFADINRVPAAHCLTWQEGALKVERYWVMPQEGPLRYPRQRDYVEHFQELLAQAVADRLRTRRVGVAMSGGLDSSSVAASAKNILVNSSRSFDLRAFTITYDQLIPDAERQYAQLVATHLKMPIEFLQADGYALFERWDQSDFRQPEPDNEPLAVIWVDLLQRMNGRSRVVLTGEGGDVILLPSATYFYKMLKSLQLGRLTTEVGQTVLMHRRLPQIGLRSSLKRWLNGTSDASPFPVWLNQSFGAKLDLVGRWRQVTQKRLLQPHPTRQELYQNLSNIYWTNLFERCYDAAVLGLPLEFRHPLFDLRLVNYALALPPLPWCVDKILLREAGRGFLPKKLLQRPKSPLAGNPVVEHLRQPGAHWVDNFVPCAELVKYVRREAIPPLGKGDNIFPWINLRPLSLNYWLKYQRSGFCRQHLDVKELNEPQIGGNHGIKRMQQKELQSPPSV